MTDYTAHQCVSIVRMNGGPEDHHGCPYKRMDEASLRAQLAALK
jgi:DNA primase large subunit